MDLSKFLSEDEIRALIDESDKAVIHDSDISEVALIDGASSHLDEAISLPGLQTIQVIYRQQLYAVLASYLHDQVAVKAMQPSITTYRKMTEVNEGFYIFIDISLAEMDQNLILRLDGAFLFHVISILFGGRPGPEVEHFKEKKTLSKIDESVAKQIAQLIIPALSKAWSDVFTLKVDQIKIDLSADLISQFAPNDQFLAIESVIQFTPEFAGACDVFIPKRMIQAQQDTLKNNSKYSKQAPELVNWQNKLKDNVLQTTLEVSVRLPDIERSFKEILALKPGSILMIDDPSLVNVYVADKIMFKALAGESEGNVALEILSG